MTGLLSVQDRIDYIRTELFVTSVNALIRTPGLFNNLPFEQLIRDESEFFKVCFNKNVFLLKDCNYSQIPEKLAEKILAQSIAKDVEIIVELFHGNSCILDIIAGLWNRTSTRFRSYKFSKLFKLLDAIEYFYSQLDPFDQNPFSDEHAYLNYDDLSRKLTDWTKHVFTKASLDVQLAFINSQLVNLKNRNDYQQSKIRRNYLRVLLNFPLVNKVFVCIGKLYYLEEKGVSN